MSSNKSERREILKEMLDDIHSEVNRVNVPTKDLSELYDLINQMRTEIDQLYAAPNVPTESEIEEAINDFVPPRYIDSPYWFNARHTARKMAEWIINCYITNADLGKKGGG